MWEDPRSFGLPQKCENIALQPCLGHKEEHAAIGLTRALKTLPCLLANILISLASFTFYTLFLCF